MKDVTFKPEINKTKSKCTVPSHTVGKVSTNVNHKSSSYAEKYMRKKGL